jgi:uncharacterized phiE125 gp8 family phage protein
MEIRVITPPTPLITLAEAKAYLRVDFSDDDSLITSLVAAASANLDGPQGWLGRAIGEQELEAYVPSFCGGQIPALMPHIISVESVRYLDTSNIEQTIDAESYSASANRIWFSDSFIVPGVYATWDAVRIAYTAGYEEIPEQLKTAVKIHVGTLYENRTSIGSAQFILPHAYEALCAPFKVWSL